MPDVIPNIYGKKILGNNRFFNGNLFSNTKLRCGEVMAVIPPKSKESVSEKHYEYHVLVRQYDRGAVATTLYRNCILINSLAGGADQCKWKLRASTQPYTEVGKTDGSRVLLLCVEGSKNQAVIIGGLSDERVGGDDKEGQFYEFEYNGVNFQVKDDGSLVLEQKGKTTNLGKPAEDRDKGAGTAVEVAANGNFTIKTKDSNQSITIDNANNTISIDSDKKVTVNGSKIELGAGASDPAVLGRELVAIMKEMLVGIQTITMFSIAGAPVPLTSPPINAPLFASISARLDSILSSQTYLKG